MRQTTIARTLMGLTALASSIALVTACVAFGWYDRGTFRANLARRGTAQAQIIAVNSTSALAFDDPTAAAATIAALSASPHVLDAAIYRPDGSRFAEYHRAGAAPAPSTVPTTDAAAAIRQRGDRLVVATPIRLEGRTLGTVMIESDLLELAERQTAYIRMALLVLIGSLTLALVMSWATQRTIARPIAELAGLAGAVSNDGDYSRRARIRSRVLETRALADTFNLMLARIEEQNRSLQQAQHELEERVRLRTAELQAVNQELEAFSYSVSHDLRAPLRHVAGFTELLEQHAGAALDEQGRKYVTRINAAARRMAKLIDDLLGLSRVGRATLSLRPVELNRAIADAKQEVLADMNLAERPVDWVLDDLPEVWADPALLHLVLVNLLSNALKYSSTRNPARIEVGRDGGADGEVAIYVRDNGVGFDMKYADKLFGVFQRLHSASQFEGTGIGLANIKRIVNRHGGRVWAEGVVDGGATFHVALPTRKGAS